MKEQRFYEVDGGAVYVYNSGFKSNATSVSIVSANELEYYRKQFKLSKVWG